MIQLKNIFYLGNLNLPSIYILFLSKTNPQTTQNSAGRVTRKIDFKLSVLF